MEINIDELIEQSLSKESNKGKWEVVVEGDTNDADYVYKRLNYDDDGFKEEGLPLVLIFRKILNKHLYDFDWSDDVLLPGDFIPYHVHSIDGVEVHCGEKEFDIDVINDEDAREIVKKFLKSDLYSYEEWEDDFVEGILNDLYPVVIKK